MPIACNTANIGVSVPNTGENYIELVPSEILSSILEDVCLSHPLPGPKVEDSRDRVAHSLSWLSPRFLYVARRTPSLWANFGLYPFAPLNSETRERLGHQVAGVLHSNALHIFIYVFDRRADALNVDFNSLVERVRKIFVPICTTAMLPRWNVFDATTCNWQRMRALLPRLRDLRFPELDTLRLSMMCTPDFPHAEQYFGSAAFPKLRILELRHVEHPGFALRADVPTSLVVKYAFRSAAARIPAIWSTIAVAGSSLDTLKVYVTVTENDKGHLATAKPEVIASNSSVKHLVLDAVSLDCLMAGGAFPEAVDLRVTKLRYADDCMATMGLVTRLGDRRTSNGTTFAPNIQSLTFDMHNTIDTAPALWRQLFSRVSKIQSVVLRSHSAGGGDRLTLSFSSLTVNLTPGGVRFWPRLERIEFHGNSKDVISRVLTGLARRHARTSAPQIELSVDFATEIHLGDDHGELWTDLQKGFNYDVQL